MFYKTLAFLILYYRLISGAVVRYTEKQIQTGDRNHIPFEVDDIFIEVELEVFLLDFVDFRNPTMYILNINGSLLEDIMVKSSRYNLCKNEKIDRYYMDIEPPPDHIYRVCYENLIITFQIKVSLCEQFFYLGIKNFKRKRLEIGMLKWSKNDMKFGLISKGYNYNKSIYSFTRIDYLGRIIPSFRLMFT